MLRGRGRSIAIEDLGEELEAIAAHEESRLFLPPARLPDGVADQRTVRNAWNAEVMAHFASMDAAGRTPEDLGLVAVRYHLDTDWRAGPARRLSSFGLDADESDEVVQVLLGFLRRDKAITMPAGVDNDAPAFGSIPWKFVYALTTGEKREGLTVRGWTRIAERLKRYGPTRVADYLSRVLGHPPEELSALISGIWDDLCEHHVLVRMNLGDFVIRSITRGCTPRSSSPINASCATAATPSQVSLRAQSVLAWVAPEPCVDATGIRLIKR